MLRWNDVRRLIVRHVAPAVCSLGFMQPGRTMRRWRPDFVDVIDFRCGKWNDCFQVTFGCELLRNVRTNPKPWNCSFYVQPTDVWPERLLQFKDTTEDQVLALEALSPMFAAEAARWFGLLPTLQAARSAADRNSPMSRNAVGSFNVPSPRYEEVVRLLEATIQEKQSPPPANSK